MKPFRFALEAVATVRKRTEGETLASYAQALLYRQNAGSQFETAERELNAAWNDLRRELGMGCAAETMTWLRLHADAAQSSCHQ